MRKILPVLLLLIGIGAGIGGGIMLKPAAEEAHQSEPHEVSDPVHADTAAPADDEGHEVLPEYVKMNNQFIIPVIRDEKVAALVVMSISIEAMPGGQEAIFQLEPKLRDEFNQVLFEHANAGGFDGVFTSSNKMLILRDSLYEVAHKVAGPVVKGVLISEIVRQDN